MTENEMVGWHHQFNGHRFAYTPAVGDGQGGLACCSSWGHKESDTTERQNRTDKGGVICISEVIDISPGNLDSCLSFIQPSVLMMYSA